MNRVVIATSIILLFCAINIGLMSSEERQKYYQRGNIVGEPPPVEVLLANRNVARAVPLRASDFEIAEWPSHKVPQNAIRSLSDIEDFFARRALIKGAPLLLSDVTRKRFKLKPRRNFDSYSLLIEPKNYDARKFPVGTIVDVIDRNGATVTPLLKKVKILSVGKSGVFSSSSKDTKSSEIVRSGMFIELEVPAELSKIPAAKGESRLRLYRKEQNSGFGEGDAPLGKQDTGERKRKKKRRDVLPRESKGVVFKESSTSASREASKQN